MKNPDEPALRMMLQSIAGLAAQAVNEGRGDEMVWVDEGNPRPGNVVCHVPEPPA